MATSQEKLAESLKELQKLQNVHGFVVIRSSDLSRTHLERLQSNGFLQEVMKGWYISKRPDAMSGDTTNWYTSYWFFVAKYANEQFGDGWCLSADQSLSLYSGNRTVPRQLIIRTSNGASNHIVKLPHNTSILYFQSSIANPVYTEAQFGLNLYSLPEALIECSPDFFKLDSIAARTCLLLLPDVSDYTIRLKLMWDEMRKVVIANFPATENRPGDIDSCLKGIEAKYKLDAYHSLSIEGYKVTDELIERVKSGNWSPDKSVIDSEQRNAMAARGYWQAFQAVKNSVKKILEGGNAGDVFADDHKTWYRELFAPSVTAGLLKPSDLAGYRSHQVYIRGSLHTPLNPDAVRDAMPVFFELLKSEQDARVRAILGHFMFVYIHPYMDGNGRIARFLMNTMLISGGYEWTIVPVERRQEYMKALEKASVEQNIQDFTLFIASLSGFWKINTDKL